LAVAVVDLVAVPVPFCHTGGRVRLGDDAAGQQLGRVQPETHGASQIPVTGDVGLLLGHGGYHRVGGVGVELRGVRVADARDGARELDDHALQTQAQAKCGDVPLAGVAKCTDLA